MKSSIDTYRQEPRLLRDYYIFTSDAVCKKAYDLMTASSVTGAISNVFGGDKKANSKSDSKDSGGMETVIGVVIGVAVLGAVGYGEYRMFGKAEAAKGTAQVLIIILLPVRSQCNDPVRRCEAAAIFAKTAAPETRQTFAQTVAPNWNPTICSAGIAG